MRSHDSNNLFVWGMILSMTCWGFSWTSGKVLASYAHPLSISFLRFGITFISLVFILRLFKQSYAVKRGGIGDLLIASTLISIYTYLFFQGVAIGKAGAGGVLVTVLNPIISYAITLAVNRRKPSRFESLGLIMGAIAGIVLLQLFTHPESLFAAGNIYFLLASISWAVLSFFTARAQRYGSSMGFSFWMYGISSLLLFVVADKEATWVAIQQADKLFWANLFFSGTITTALATTFFFFATARVGASKASSFIFMVPFSAALGSWLFLNEVPQWHTIVGGGLGVVAVYILNKR
jgi:drug/metabolite transporter (DMT)-like permease